MRICILQMSPGQDKSANIAQAQTLVDRAVNEHRPRLISFPEVWTCLGGSVKKHPQLSFPSGGPRSCK
jgi:deaminated glutathione amidase